MYMDSFFKFIRLRSHIRHLKKIDAIVTFPFMMRMHSVHNSFRYNTHNTNSARSTIFALSTAPGISSIAVIRISGPNSSRVLLEMGKMKKLPEPRKAVLCKISDPKSNELLDKALALWFPSPNSFTGEDMCELHIHGGIAVIKSVLNALQKMHQFRLAEPGEFTKRAFMAEKLDLTEVEGLADLLHAETEVQQKQALRQMEGILNKLYSSWSNKIKKCLANTEAYIDFSEDQHLDNTILGSIQQDLDQLKEEMSNHLSDARRGERLRNGVLTVLIGRPNVGKSSLLNSLCQRNIAIVSPTAGTTRDIIETSFNLGGYLVNISDTAGIRETEDSIELEGVKRAKDRSSNADLLLFILEAKRALEINESNKSASSLVKGLLPKELGPSFIKDLNNFTNFGTDSRDPQIKNENSNIILLLNKIDLLTEGEMQKVKQLEDSYPSICPISCTKGTGMDKFLSLFSNIVKEMCSSKAGEEPSIIQERHRIFVQNCLQNILEFEETVDLDVAIAAEKLRLAMNELGKITGKVRVNDILDVVFRDFCIGK